MTPSTRDPVELDPAGGSATQGKGRAHQGGGSAQQGKGSAPQGDGGAQGGGEATPRDRAFLARAVELGRRGWGRVHPNPMVGCVLVHDDQVVGEGWHRELGGPHAEVEALRAAGAAAARGATAYVSLEPCNHQGRTPPCTRALVQAGVRRVVYGGSDPGPADEEGRVGGRGSGGGARALARAGVQVVGPLLSSEEARRENPAFFHSDPTRPWTVLKLALSLDGGIAAAAGERTRVSGDRSAARVHHLRAGFDAVMVGAATARVDDPLLTVRGAVEPRVPPARVVVDARGSLDPGARLLREGASPVHLLVTGAAPEARVRALEEAGARVHRLEGRDERVPLAAAMAALRAVQVGALLCEGGGRLGSALLSAGLVDRLILVAAPRFLGPDAVPAFVHVDPEGAGDWAPVAAPEVVGDDLWLTLDRRVSAGPSPGVDASAPRGSTSSADPSPEER